MGLIIPVQAAVIAPASSSTATELRREQDYCETDEGSLLADAASETLQLNFKALIGLDVLAASCWRFLLRGVSTTRGNTTASGSNALASFAADGSFLGRMWLSNAGGGNGQINYPLEIVLAEGWSGLLDVTLTNRSGSAITHFLSVIVHREPRHEYRAPRRQVVR